MRRLAVLLLVCLAAFLSGKSCKKGGGGGGGAGTGGRSCDGSCSQRALSVADVQTIIAQAVAEAGLNGVDNATIAIVDRVGNVLAVYQMAGAATTDTTLVTSGRGVTSGLENAPVLVTLAAISKAGTAAYLSSQGNAFTTRTASQIVQEHFNPGESNRAGGPLFGVQFSQLPCGDIVRRFDSDMSLGPKRMPLGFSADPGAFPLYIDSVPVGAVGVEFDGTYTLDPDILGIDTDLEERIATAASFGYRAPGGRRADVIAVDGRFLRFADDEGFLATPADVAAFDPSGLVTVPDFADPVVVAGTQLLDAASGIVSSSVGPVAAEVLVDGSGTNLFEPTDSSVPPVTMDPPVAGDGLSAAEVTVILREALAVAERARAQIRRPLGSAARVNVTVVDRVGNVLAFARSPDAPLFGIDVSVQKARTAAFFSGTDAAANLTAAGLGSYVTAVQAFIPTAPGDPPALTNGIAFSDRAGGNLSRPFFPDGIDGNSNGPFSRPLPDWSPFSTGLQLDAVQTNLLAALADPTLTTCTAASLSAARNGFQIFPGSVPIYRGSDLIGGIGVSGDGVDQDDLVAFLGLHNAGLALGGAIKNAPAAIRADTISIGGVRLRFVSCPPAPFLDSNDQNVCAGL